VFASCVEGIIQFWTLIVVRKLNEGIAKVVTFVDW